MKIRTIIGVLLVLALVLGSTGAAFAAQGDRDGDGPIRDRVRDVSCQDDVSVLADQDCIRDCDKDCDLFGDGPIQDRLHDVSCQNDVSIQADQDRIRDCDEDCEPIGGGPHYGRH